MKTLQLTFRYIKYFFTAKTKHSVQAPFLYEFITIILNKKSDDQNCKDIEQLRRGLCKSEDIIKITDYGAGSHVNDNKTRKIKELINKNNITFLNDNFSSTGRAKAAVFPVPVCATPSTSLPPISKGMASSCTGVGL